MGAQILLSLNLKQRSIRKNNRNVFQFNKYVDQKIISPISKTYVKKVPAKIRSGVSNHLQWMDTPNTIINSALQRYGKYDFSIS